MDKRQIGDKKRLFKNTCVAVNIKNKEILDDDVLLLQIRPIQSCLHIQSVQPIVTIVKMSYSFLVIIMKRCKTESLFATQIHYIEILFK